MSSIGSIGGGSWSTAALQQRPQRPSKEELFKRADSDGSGGVDAAELQQLLANRPGAASSTSGTASTTDSGSSVDFSKLDGDGNGSLDATELDAAMKSLSPKPSSTMEFAQMRGMDGMGGPGGPGGAGGPPPADGGGQGGGTSSAGSTDSTSSSSSTTYDPLDTNEDGVVSAQERAAGEIKKLMEQALQAADSNGDQSLSASELSSFKDAITQALDKATGASSSSSTGAGSGSSSSSSSSASNRSGSGNGKLDEQAAKLVDWMLKQYAAGGGNGGNAFGSSTGTQVNVSA